MVNLDRLNPEQRQAATSTHNKILTLAGAGTGKTGTLTTRIAYLVDRRIPCSNMLALTFTRLAGREMKERVIRLVGDRMGRKLFCNTFHAFCVKVLKEHGYLLGYDKDFSIYDQEDQAAVLYTVIQDCHLKTSAKKILEVMSGDPRTRFAYINDKDIDLAISEYYYRLKKHNAFDFGGLLSYTLQLFHSYPEVIEEYRKIYTHVFLDEFQDTNDQQWEIIELLNPENIFVVGDDFQAIYGWRGANIEIILSLAADPEWEVIKLQHNYRSTRQIIEAANKLIKFNKQTDKILISNIEGESPVLAEYYNDADEANRILFEIAGMVKNNRYQDFAVLARTNAQLDYINEQATKLKLPVTLVNNKGNVFKEEDIKKILGYLALIVNPLDDVSFKKAVNFPIRRITDLELTSLQLHAIQNEQSLWYMFKEGYWNEKGERIIEIIRTATLEPMDIYDSFNFVVTELELKQYYDDRGLVNKVLDIENVLKFIEKWIDRQRELGEDTTVSEFLKWLQLRDIQDKLEEKESTVKLMTIHAAKGLEFDTVFITGLNQGTFPSTKGDIEEERRLMYVGITRAKFKLRLSRPERLFLYNHEQLMAPSQFIKESQA